MMDFLTNNGLAMRLIECSGHDHFWIAAMLALDAVVVLAYFSISADTQTEYSKLGEAGVIAKGFRDMALVFGFCAFAGYGLDYLSLFIPVYRLKVLLLIPLAIASVSMAVRMRRTHMVRLMFQLEQDAEALLGRK